jgi:hypothetical protein
MISAAGKYAAARPANRCMRTAPIAKFGATTTFDSPPSSSRSRSISRRSASETPVVPTTTWTACAMHQRTSSITTSGCVKSTATSTSASSSRSSSSLIGTSTSGRPMSRPIC